MQTCECAPSSGTVRVVNHIFLLNCSPAYTRPTSKTLASHDRVRVHVPNPCPCKMKVLRPVRLGVMLWRPAAGRTDCWLDTTLSPGALLALLQSLNHQLLTSVTCGGQRSGDTEVLAGWVWALEHLLFYFYFFYLNKADFFPNYIWAAGAVVTLSVSSTVAVIEQGWRCSLILGGPGINEHC